jgi:hypothetical protein
LSKRKIRGSHLREAIRRENYHGFGHQQNQQGQEACREPVPADGPEHEIDPVAGLLRLSQTQLKLAST